MRTWQKLKAFVRSVVDEKAPPTTCVGKIARGTLRGCGFGLMVGAAEVALTQKWRQPTRSLIAREIAATTLRGAVGFGLYSGLDATVRCAIAAVRKKDDLWNSALTGCITGGLFAVGTGPKGMLMGSAQGMAIATFIDWRSRRPTPPKKDETTAAAAAETKPPPLPTAKTDLPPPQPTSADTSTSAVAATKAAAPTSAVEAPKKTAESPVLSIATDNSDSSCTDGRCC